MNIYRNTFVDVNYLLVTCFKHNIKYNHSSSIKLMKQMQKWWLVNYNASIKFSSKTIQYLLYKDAFKKYKTVLFN